MRLAALGLLVALSVSACSGNGNPAAPSQQTPPQQTQPPAPTLYTIQGTVRQAGNGPMIAGATVRVVDGPNAGQTATTDASGLFSLPGLTFAGFTIEGSAPGYETVSGAAGLVAGQTTRTVQFNLRPAAIWSFSGTGATVGDMPTYVSRVRVIGDYGGRCENFIIWVGGRLLTNEILGTCAVATAGSHFEGTYLTSGGVIEVKSSSGISWLMVEVR